MITVNAKRSDPICLRHQGEHDAMRVAFDLSAFEADWPGGTPSLLVQRPRSSGDKEAYPAALSVDEDTAYWTVGAADAAYSGYGKVQLEWRVDGALVKSCVYDTVCVPSLQTGAEPPDEPSKRWFEALEEKIGDLSELTTKAKENLVAAINEAAKTGSGGAGSIDMQVSGGYIQYSTDGGETWENLIAVEDLKGGKGEKGDTGATPDIQIGTVTTLPAGSDATASMSGTAENPLLNLGIPKGAGGGATDLSLGITGATIGQIAKITAVDTDGKPTKWEAVSDEYELLIDQPALTEDVVLCNFDVPDCDKYIVLVSLVNTSASAGSRALQVNMNGSNGYKAITGIANVIGTSGTRSAYFKIERLQNRFYSMVWNNQNGDGIVDGMPDNMSSCNMCAFDAPENGVQKLTVTSLNNSISHFLGVGTRIKIYGVKKL